MRAEHEQKAELCGFLFVWISVRDKRGLMRGVSGSFHRSIEIEKRIRK